MFSIGIAADLLGVCIKTLRRWDYKKKICSIRTLGGHRRFSIQEIHRLLEEERSLLDKKPCFLNSPKVCAIYGRVSSHKQNKRGDLERQIKVLKAHALKEKLSVYRTYKDVGSGLNTKRKGLWRLLRDAKAYKFSKILVNYKDRLTRFGYNYLKNYLAEFGVTLVSLNKLEDKTPESEMVEDLVAIIHSFSGKLYGLRSGKNKKSAEKKVQKSKNQ